MCILKKLRIWIICSKVLPLIFIARGSGKQSAVFRILFTKYYSCLTSQAYCWFTELVWTSPVERSHRLLTKLIAFRVKMSFTTPCSEYLYPKTVFLLVSEHVLRKLDWTIRALKFSEFSIPFGIFYNSFGSVIQVWATRSQMRPCTFQGQLTHRNGSAFRGHTASQRDTQQQQRSLRWLFTSPFSSD